MLEILVFTTSRYPPVQYRYSAQYRYTQPGSAKPESCPNLLSTEFRYLKSSTDTQHQKLKFHKFLCRSPFSHSISFKNRPTLSRQPSKLQNSSNCYSYTSILQFAKVQYATHYLDYISIEKLADIITNHLIKNVSFTSVKPWYDYESYKIERTRGLIGHGSISHVFRSFHYFILFSLISDFFLFCFSF